MRRRLLRLLSVLLAGACSRAPAAARDGVRHERVEHAGTVFEVVWVDPARARIALFWKDPAGRPYRSLAALERSLARRGERLLAATNAGIYDSARARGAFRADTFPLGLHVEDGRTLRELNLREVRRGEPGWGNFYVRPGAVFLVDRAGRARVVDTRAVPALRGGIAQATQSGPALVLDGRYQGRYGSPGGTRLVRNGVGVCADGRVALVYTPAATLHELASAFRERLGCPDALYLDGSISGLHVPGRLREENGRYAGIIGVLARQ